MILRLIALAILLFFAYRAIRRVLSKLQPPQADSRIPDSQPVVPCKSCGTFVPKKQALEDGQGHFYCSDKCREAFRQEN
ncbi:PP0621 family protein [Thiohalorhabdus methylotrophus]|uniref:PP0621 family protein n=1 Tax=Thiohalorhabdus methylotrophus TaxID=3242694 RepID=A0ABV4TQ72_9GAMM